jgi:protein ImuA
MTTAAEARPPAPSALEQLLEQRPDLWRGGHTPTDQDGLPSGFAALDQALVTGGWPRDGLIEVLVERHGDAFALVLPLLVRLSIQPRWLLLIDPPWLPYAPALAGHGLALDRLLICHAGKQAPWTMEQGLRSGACAAVLGWDTDWPSSGLRRLQLAAAETKTPALLFRPIERARQPSPARLRLKAAPTPAGLQLTIHKQRGGNGGGQIQVPGI